LPTGNKHEICHKLQLVDFHQQMLFFVIEYLARCKKNRHYHYGTTMWEWAGEGVQGTNRCAKIQMREEGE
jgi:hypothetical protein